MIFRQGQGTPAADREIGVRPHSQVSAVHVGMRAIDAERIGVLENVSH